MNAQIILAQHAKMGKWSKAQQLAYLLEFIDYWQKHEPLKQFLIKVLARETMAKAEMDRSFFLIDQARLQGGQNWDIKGEQQKPEE